MANHLAQSIHLNSNAIFLPLLNHSTPEDMEIVPECEELLKPHDQNMCDKHMALYFETLQGNLSSSIGWPTWAFKSNDVK